MCGVLWLGVDAGVRIRTIFSVNIQTNHQSTLEYIGPYSCICNDDWGAQLAVGRGHTHSIAGVTECVALTPLCRS